MLLITGTPRSGTTLLAAFCKMMGHDPGGDYKRETNRGLEEGFARVALDQLKRRNLEACDLIIDRYDRSVFKQPHFLDCGRPEFLERWAGKKSELRVLILLRDPRQLAISLSENASLFNEWGSVDITETKYRHLSEMFLEAVRKLDLPHEVLRFPEFLTAYDQVELLLTSFAGLRLKPKPEAMPQFGVTYEDGDTPRRVWEKWIEPTRVRHVRS
ncbi:MAG TPA: hypothetical protein VHC19_22390 [Pirellulales bacterium]|nr:hypothetical protein [Pirellulales bacterium]